MILREGDTIFTLAPKRWAAEHGLFPLDLLPTKDRPPLNPQGTTQRTAQASSVAMDAKHKEKVTFEVSPPSQNKQEKPPPPPVEKYPPNFEADPRTLSPIDLESPKKATVVTGVMSEEKLVELVDQQSLNSTKNVDSRHVQQASPSPRRRFNTRTSEDVKDDAEGFHMDM